MIEPTDTGEAPQKASLRRAAAAIERELATLTSETKSTDDPSRLSRLLSSWAQMVAALDLGPAPVSRPCPFCGATAMRAATRCGTCWAALTPSATPSET